MQFKLKMGNETMHQ
jgi:hypothetical protein